MHAYNLGFISDQDIFNHVKDTVEKYRFKIDFKKFNKNLIDPIKLSFDTGVYNKNIEQIINDEVLRQIDKSNTNHIGYFHQNIFKYLGNDWEVPIQGFDVVNKKIKYYVEMKNKHNTMNASSSQKTYMKMQNTILNNKDATCALVEVIAKKSQNIKWSVSLDKQQMSCERIRRVSIDKFYELVTGDKYAFKKLCELLPLIIKDVIDTLQVKFIQNTVFQELKALSVDLNILETIYLLSFEKYEGFNEFHLK